MVNILGEDEAAGSGVRRFGSTVRRIEEATGIRRETAGRYLKAAGIEVRPRAGGATQVGKSGHRCVDRVGRGDGTLSETAPAEPASPARAPRASACEPYPGADRTRSGSGSQCQGHLAGPGRRYHGFAAATPATGAARFAKRLRRRRGREAHPVIVTPPGERPRSIRHGPHDPPPSERAVSAYSAVLCSPYGYSRKSVRLLTFRSSTGIWAELHERAFRRLGGAPRVVVCLTIRGKGFSSSPISTIPPSTLFFEICSSISASSGAPLSVANPDRKGKVKSGVGHAPATPLKGLRFDSPRGRPRATSIAGSSAGPIPASTAHTKRQVAAMFAEERPALLPLPVEPFRHYQFAARTVRLDGCVEGRVRLLRPPPAGWGGTSPCSGMGSMSGCSIHPPATPARASPGQQRGHHRILEQDKPQRTPPTTLALLNRASHARPKVGAPCNNCTRARGSSVSVVSGRPPPREEVRTRRRRSRRCRRPRLGIADYRSPPPLPRAPARRPISLRQVDPLIRQLTHYRDVIARKPGGALITSSTSNAPSAASASPVWPPPSKPVPRGPDRSKRPSRLPSIHPRRPQAAACAGVTAAPAPHQGRGLPRPGEEPRYLTISTSTRK